MNVLIEKLKKSRETRIDADKFAFTVRRPTDLEAVQMRGEKLTQGDIMRRFVTDWHNVTELDIIPGGTGVPVPFETDLFMEWVADYPGLWSPIVAAVLNAYEAHQNTLADSLGKQGAG